MYVLNKYNPIQLFSVSNTNFIVLSINKIKQAEINGGCHGNNFNYQVFMLINFSKIKT